MINVANVEDYAHILYSECPEAYLILKKEDNIKSLSIDRRASPCNYRNNISFVIPTNMNSEYYSDIINQILPIAETICDQYDDFLDIESNRELYHKLVKITYIINRYSKLV